MAQTFSWKPALLGAREEVRVDGTSAQATRGTKTRKVRFADVTGARFLEIHMRTSSVSLVLLHRDGKFAVNYGGRVSYAAHDRHAAGFVAASVAILEGLAAAKPGLALQIGPGPGLRWTMAVLGLMMVGVGAPLALLPFAEGMDGEGLVLFIMAAFFALVGVGVIRRYNPFAKLPTATAADLANTLRPHLPPG